MLFNLEDVQCEEIIGSGAFATVYKARLRHHRNSQVRASMSHDHEYLAQLLVNDLCSVLLMKSLGEYDMIVFLILIMFSL